MNLARSPLAVLSLTVATAALAACSSSSSSGKSAETTAAKVDAERADARERLDSSAQLVTDLSARIPEPVAARSQCVVAIPSMVKAGVIIGGQSGKGYATCQTSRGWSAPAPVSIAGGTIGAQIGAEATDLLALVIDNTGTRALASGHFKVGVDASAAAGPVGTGRGTGADVNSNSDLVSYSRSKGLFAGVTLNGTTITADNDAIKALYGSSEPLTAILGGQVAVPEGASEQRFLSAVRTGFGTGRSNMPQSSR